MKLFSFLNYSIVLREKINLKKYKKYPTIEIQS